MNMTIQSSRWFVPLGSAVLALLLVSVAWFSVVTLRSDAQPRKMIRSVEVSMEVYSSLEELSSDADAVVVSRVKRAASTGVDRGASGDGIAVPYTLYELEVLETLKGETNDLIYVIGWDPDFFVNTSLNSTPVTDLREGETVVLYLEEGTPEASPTITITDRFYVTLGIDNGVFDVVSAGASGPVGRVNDDAVVNPRGTSADMFGEETTFNMSDVRHAIEPDSDEVGPIGSVN